MASLISLERAKKHLRMENTDEENDDILMKAEQATAIVINYLKDRADPLWDEETVPGSVQSAIFVMLTNIYERDPNQDEAAWKAVERLVERYRDPTLA